MATKTAERTSSDLIDVAINELIMHEENNGFKRGELKPFVEMLEKKYNIPFSTLKGRYYKEIKDKVKQNTTKKNKTIVVKKEKNLDKKTPIATKEEGTKAIAIVEAPPVEVPVQEVPKQETPKPKPLSIDESVMAHAHKQADKIFSYPKDYYKLGQMVEVKVVNIQSYGCFCEITDGRGFQALCHISELVDGFIKKVTDYVEVGDIIQGARICLIESKRINVTMKHLHLKKKEVDVPVETTLAENPPINNLGDKLHSLKDKILARAVENNASPVQANDEKEVEELFAQEGLNESQEKIIQKYERDIEEMTSYLQEQLGVLTPQAKLELANIIEEQGVFKTTRGILKTQENFKADIGLLFMRQMKEKLGEYL